MMEFVTLNGVTFVRATAGSRFALRLPTWSEVAMLRGDNPEVFDARLIAGDSMLYVIGPVDDKGSSL
jgi:hypothetical protein